METSIVSKGSSSACSYTYYVVVDDVRYCATVTQLPGTGIEPVWISPTPHSEIVAEEIEKLVLFDFFVGSDDA